MKCPHCSRELSHETYEGVQIDRCPGCRGVWLDEGELSLILERREETFSPSQASQAVASAFTGIPAEESAKTRACPRCASAMSVLNYDYRSGIIIDRCRSCPGLWLDRDELDKVQMHTEHWEREAMENRGEWAKRLNKTDATPANETTRPVMKALDWLIEILD